MKVVWVSIDHEAEAFNDYFLNLVDNLKMDNVNTDLAISLLKRWFANEYSDMIVIPITESELICTVASIKNKNSSGYDGVSNKILRLCGQFLSKTTCLYFEFIFNAWYLSKSFKIFYH